MQEEAITSLQRSMRQKTCCSGKPKVVDRPSDLFAAEFLDVLKMAEMDGEILICKSEDQFDSLCTDYMIIGNVSCNNIHEFDACT